MLDIEYFVSVTVSVFFKNCFETLKCRWFEIQVAYNSVLCELRMDFSGILMYPTRAIITRGFHTFHPIFEGQKRLFKEHFS